MIAPLAFLDTETTGLDFERHEVWEIGAIARDFGEEDREFLFQIQPNLEHADPTGLRISRYYEREKLTHVAEYAQSAIIWLDDEDPEKRRWAPTTPWHIAYSLARMLDGRHVIGAVPSFDANFLTEFLRLHGQAPTWHYHLIDVENLAVGYLAGQLSIRGDKLTTEKVGILQRALQPPYRSDDLAEWCGIPKIDEGDRHTALGDARWVRDWWDQIMGTD